jgi:hypothetical protein
MSKNEYKKKGRKRKEGEANSVNAKLAHINFNKRHKEKASMSNEEKEEDKLEIIKRFLQLREERGFRSGFRV